MRLRVASLLAAALLVQVLALSGCYETPQPDCAFFCGPERECPDGYNCRADGWCVRDGVSPEPACSPPGVDAAATIDAGAADPGPAAAPTADLMVR